MKKLFFIAAIASVALVSCVKNEVVPANDSQQEITYMTSPVTKAHGIFATTNVFYSWAFYTPTDWATNQSTATQYGTLANKAISYSDNVWKNTSEIYYWPKAGKLTFFAYSLNSNTGLDTGVTCDATNGIKVVDYNVNTRKNVDFLVADMAKDLSANSSTTYYKSGVPTLFRHKLSNVIFKIQTDKDYTSSKVFTFKSLKLKKLETQGDYTQIPAASEGWSNWESEVDETVYSDTEVVFNSSLGTPTASQSFYLPQAFDDNETAYLTYTVTSGASTETVVVEKKLSQIFTGNWEMGKKYTCTITVSLNEINWDPAVEEWTDNSASWAIN